MTSERNRRKSNMRRKEGKRAKWKEERIVREGDGGEAGHQRVYDDSEHNPGENARSVQEENDRDTDKNIRWSIQIAGFGRHDRVARAKTF